MIDSNDLETLLMKAKKSPKTMSKMAREIGQAIEACDSSYSKPTIPLYYLEESLSANEFSFRNYSIQDLNEIESLFNDTNSYIEFAPEEIVPLPDILPISDYSLLTPFPFMVESPVLNADIDYESIFNKIISNTSQLNDGAHKVI